MNLESIRSHLFAGQAIPAMPLALNEDASWSQQHQRALVRYYLDAGVGGIAVGVHSTQFEIRDPEHALFEPVLKLCSEEIDSWLGENASPLLKIAGICGKTQQALQESELALKNGYHAGLLSMTAMSDSSQDELLAHCEDISQKNSDHWILSPTVRRRSHSPLRFLETFRGNRKRRRNKNRSVQSLRHQ